MKKLLLLLVLLAHFTGFFICTSTGISSTYKCDELQHPDG